MLSKLGLLVGRSISHHSLSIKFHSLNSTPKLTKKECIFHLKTCKSMQNLKQIHAQLFRIGLHQNNDFLSKIILFSTDPFMGNLKYAEKLFNYIENPSLFVYNLMIKAYTKSGFCEESLLFFGMLREKGLSPDDFTYPFVLKAIGIMGYFKEGMKIHGFALKSGMGFDAYVINSLIDMYMEMGCVWIAKKVFDEMPERDLVSWNVMISGFVRCGMFEDAVGVFMRMVEESDLRPDEATVVSTLSACAATKNLETGKNLHRFVEEGLGFTPRVGNALVDMYCKCGCLSVAHQVFDEILEKNVNCWTSMVSGYVNFGHLEEARALFDRAPVTDVVLWTAMINGYVQFNRFEEAMELFHEMQIRRIRPDKFTLVALLTGCAQKGALEQGKWIHACIEANRFAIDAVVGTALVEMYAKCGCIDKAFEIFDSLKVKDVTLWTSIICGLAINGRTSQALDLFSEMKHAGFKPDDITFIGVLTACSHGGLVEEGKKHFNSMKSIYSIEPKLEHYGCFVDLLGRAGRLHEADEYIQSIPDDKNDHRAPLYGALLSACRTYGDVKMGERVAKCLVEIESKGSSGHALLANIYASANRWEDVNKVRKKMKVLGVEKLPGCSLIEIGDVIREFFAGDETHPEINKVHSMLNDMVKPLSWLEENETDIS